MVANLKDNIQSWMMFKNGKYKRIKNENENISAHEYFMSNPSLSGRGKSIKYSRPKELSFKNK